MKKTRKAMMYPVTSLACVLVLLLGMRVLAICPPTCLCARGHRVVDCSGRNLSLLPDRLQHNIRELNLSRNSLHNLDGLLSHFAHLRLLDVSHNQLTSFPARLPRALWEIRASGNRLRLLEKNDTAYQWNLKVLDLSGNELERVVFINNTLPNLHSLNLSHNKFWTVPTNMPSNLETVDLSHNFLVQILPGSLDRLSRLARFYLHDNRFSSVSERAFSQLGGLRLITLYDNPWACEEEENVTGLLVWMRQTPALVLGCPCYTHHVCGEARPRHPPTSGPWWPAQSHSPAPDAEESGWPTAQAVTSGYRPKSALFRPPSDMTASNLSAADPAVFRDGGHPWAAATRGPAAGTNARTSTTPGTGSAKKTNAVVRSTNRGPTACAPETAMLNLLLARAAWTLT
ncbi:oligodendrocyte-myelin glycoprotein [Lepisosteus oculatus]|uniref:oligodendrocyte-myelin glycoprotein n=1 Tax=Lepisosteus oculatus TaxID=7918 RepID=UPI00371F87DF